MAVINAQLEGPALKAVDYFGQNVFTQSSRLGMKGIFHPSLLSYGVVSSILSWGDTGSPL